jgi:hypothetical protein
MTLDDLLVKSGGLEAIARDLGVSERQVEVGASALLPAILGGFQKRAPANGNGGGIGALLEQLGGGGLLDNVIAAQPTEVSRGNDVLGQIFGSKDVSRTVAQHAAAQTGLEPSLLKKMLPIVAMLVTGYLAKKRGAAGTAGLGGNDLGGLLGGLLDGSGEAPTSAGLGGLGGLASMLDADGNGNPLDDILRMAGQAQR